jgi:VWFA-related protein
MRRAVILVFAAALLAQEPTFKTSTKLVIVNIAVHDKSGKPIENLSKNDFTIYEDNQPQSISVFEYERLKNEALPAAAPALIVRPATPTAPAPDRPNMKDRRLLAFLFDFSSMLPAEQLRAQAAALKFIQTQMTASDLVTILSFSNRLRVVEDFTDDRDRLIAAIRGFRLGESSELAVEGATGADDTDDSGAFTPDETEFNIFNTDRKLSALEDAAKKLAMYPEKKALIYFSSGVGRTGVENESQLRSTVNAAVRANVAFYPIDARGLIATPLGGDASTASPKGTGIFTGKTQQNTRDRINNQQETLFTLAADTGGKALLDNNDLGMGITQAQKDIGAYYILGYYSTNTAEDGKYRKIRVKLNNNLQAKLDFRPGYYASKTFQKFTSSDKERQLEEALALGDPVTDLPLAIEIDYFRISRNTYFVPISVKIPGTAVALSRKDSADLDFIGQILDNSGKLVTGVRDGITIKLKENEAAQLTRRQLQYDTGVTLSPGDYRLKFIARENQTGKMGAFETKFTIPDLAKQSSNVRLSSVIWSNQREPLSASVGSAGNNKKLLATHPLIQDGQKLIPSITHVFRKDQQLYVYFEIYDPTQDPEASVTAQLTLFNNQSRTFESRPVRQNKPTRPNTISFQFQLPLKDLPPANYTAQLTIIDEQARKFAFARSPLVVRDR